MSVILTVLHIVACIFLIVVVLLQTGKGADIGAVFGGSSQTIFGSSGASNLLTKLTTWTAAVFMATSLFLTWQSSHHLTVSIADQIPAEPPPLATPAAESAPAAAAGPAASRPEEAGEKRAAARAEATHPGKPEAGSTQAGAAAEAGDQASAAGEKPSAAHAGASHTAGQAAKDEPGSATGAESGKAP